MAESSRNAVVDNATKDSYFLMHIASTRRKEREDKNRLRGRRKTKRKRKVASAGKTSEYGDAGTDIEESRGRYRGREVGGVCKYFSNPHRKPGSPFSRLVFRASLSSVRIAIPHFFPSCRFFLFSIAFHTVFSFLLSFFLLLRI
ncbi:hypothetical protein ALC53_10341 [Atta colombica]|uniref:Transmembrane protein n=1 Tax=Atta colombica TaxID=520822 RepID=A0A195B4I2_9HYME|nr:hypothetical protein ALC53_10341 [Atta colombica]